MNARLVTITAEMVRAGAPREDVIKMLRRNGLSAAQADRTFRQAVRTEANMPLKRGASRKVIGENIATEERSGRSRKQSIAIALSEARRTARRGEKAPPPYPRKRKRAQQARKNTIARRKSKKAYCSKCRGPHVYKHGKA